jgi:hypothetical protein
MRTALAASTLALSTLMLTAPPWSWASDAKAPPVAVAATNITFSFKVDPRLLGPTYGGERWVSPPTYTGVAAQDAVDTRALAVDARGGPVRTDLEWTVSDPELLTVSPPRGQRVTITARRPGVSKVTVKAGGASRTLTVRSEKPDGTWKVSVSQ